MLANWYDYILQGDDATEDNARLAVMTGVLCTVDTKPQTLAYMRYVDTVHGIDIYYCYGADYYAFKDE